MTEIFARTEPTANVADIVADIIATVQRDGDKALLAFTEKFDKAALESLRVSDSEIESAFSLVPERFIEVLKRAAENIRAFHSMQKREGFRIQKGDVILGQPTLNVVQLGHGQTAVANIDHEDFLFVCESY